MTLTAETFDFVATLVRQRSAIQLERGKEYLVESRLAPLARSAGALDVDAYVRGMRADVTKHDMVVEALTTNETSWFRDLNPFTVLRSTVVPDLVDRGKFQMRIWSAACSTGQEAFSIAMILADNFPSVRASIVATDLADHVLAKGRSGRYTQLEINRGLPAPMLVKHFERQGPAFEISSALRSQVVFRKHNLLDNPPAGGPFDIVFLRNVLIYFDVATKRDVLRRVRGSLAPGGYLFLGRRRDDHRRRRVVGANPSRIELRLPAPRRESDMKALVIDDSRVMRRIVSNILVGVGFDTIEAENGQVALDQLESHDDVGAVLHRLEHARDDGLRVRCRGAKAPRVAQRDAHDGHDGGRTGSNRSCPRRRRPRVRDQALHP